MEHLSQKQLLRFLRGETSEVEAEAVYVHLLECTACENRQQTLKNLRTDPDATLGSFVQEWDALHRSPTLRLVAFVETDPPLALGGLAGAPSDWADTEAPLEVGIAGEDTRKTQEALRTAHKALDQHKRDQTREHLIQVSETSPHKAALSQRELTYQGRQAALLVVDAKRQSLSVLMYKPDVGSLVRLITEDGACREATLERVPEASYRLAEFEQVDAGWYTLEILDPPPQA